MKKNNLITAVATVFIMTTSCDFIKNATSNPEQIYNKIELEENIGKLQKDSKYNSVDDMEFWDISVRFSYSNIEGNRDMFVDYNLTDAEDNNKLANQSYQRRYSTFRKAYNVKVVDANNNEVKDYNLFKDNLFKLSDLKQFSNLDDLMKQALENSNKANEDNYISSMTISSVPQVTYTFGLKNKKDVTYTQTIKFDDNGKLISK